MELRQYWRVLVRRRNVVRNVFVLALVLSLITTGYGASRSFYQGSAVIDLQMQPELARVSGAVVDPIQAAHQNTDQVVLAASVYASTGAYFKAVSAALHKQGIDLDWQTLGAGFGIGTGKSHAIDLHWSSSDANVARSVVAVGARQLLDWVPVWQKEAMPSSPKINGFVLDAPRTQRLRLSKVLTDVGLKAALGLAAGILLAYLFDYLDPTLRDEADVERWLGLPTLAVIPGAKPVRRARQA